MTLQNKSIIDLAMEADTQHLGKVLSAYITTPTTIGFCGEIGAGKTTLIRAMLRALGVSSAIKSPTFSLVESYQIAQMNIHHFDLYRIHDASELEFIGFRDYFAHHALCLIEWPERAMHLLDGMDMKITIRDLALGRQAEITAYSSNGSNLLSSLASEL